MTDHRPSAAGGAAGEPADGERADSHDEPRELVESPGGQRGAELVASRQELAECRAEVERLRQGLASCQREPDCARNGLSAMEQQAAELGNLYVVMERLHGTLEHGEVLAAVQDVVINVIGSEELAVFEPSEDGRELRPVQSFGVEARRLGPIRVGAGPIGRAAADSKAWVIGDGPPPPELPDLTACVPLQAGGRVVGVLAIWRMLRHKPVLGAADRSVLELVARHAATALYLTSLRERPRREQGDAREGRDGREARRTDPRNGG
jgi:GAF domain-containing protein